MSEICNTSRRAHRVIADDWPFFRERDDTGFAMASPQEGIFFGVVRKFRAGDEWRMASSYLWPLAGG